MDKIANYFKRGWLGGKNKLHITSPMGMRNGRMHQGVDIGVPVGTYIEAPLDGVVVYASLMSGYGLIIELKCEVYTGTVYHLRFAHLHKIENGITVGSVVKAGQRIALTGGATNDKPNCGRSTGPHLHLEVIFGGKRLNPLNFIVEELSIKGGHSFSYVSEGSAVNSTQFFVDEAELDTEDNYEDFDITPYVDTSATEEVEKKRKRVLSNQKRTAPGIWGITKLLMDSSVAKRQVIDSSISMMTGSLQTWFNKVCQEPFVEFSGDTYGDEYFFFVRKPPFDLEMINRGLQYKLDIPDNEIVSVNVNWNTQGIYSWYQLIPFAETMGMENVQMYMPAIFFPEYASIYGSRDLTIRSQYVNLFNRDYANADDEEKKKDNGINIMRNLIADLKYMIDSNAYTPFTRSGTITLNGDRRIKRGTFILMPNNEVFYVESVNNSLSISENSYQRSTTLNVSHGMFLPFINGVEVKEQDGKHKYGYFNLIDYGENFSVDKLNQGNYEEMISKWKVNFNCFTFFLSRKQVGAMKYMNL